MTEAKIENAVRSLYFKGKTQGYGDINAWDFLVEFTKNVLEELEGPSETPIKCWRDEMVKKGKGQMNMDEELKPMPSGLAENQAAQAGMLLGLLKRVHAVEKLVGMDRERSDWEADYKAARDVRHDKVDALERAKLALDEHDRKIESIEASGREMGWLNEVSF